MMSKASDSDENWVLVLDSISRFYAIDRLHFLLHTVSYNQRRTVRFEQCAFAIDATFMSGCALPFPKQ
jgi:hypothetical protein